MATSPVSRRAFLRHMPVAAAAVALPAATAAATYEPFGPDKEMAADRHRPAGPSLMQITQRIDDLIAAHEKAWLEFNASCSAADNLNPDYGGVVAEELHQRLMEAETDALMALLREPTPRPSQMRKKALYLWETMGGRWEPDFENVYGLIQSMLAV